MATADDYLKYIELRKELIKTNTSIVTPNLGSGNHLHYTYLRISFIAKTIDYLANRSIFSNIDKIEGSVIRSAVASTSWLLAHIPSASSLDILLFEMSEGLGLLDREDLGYTEVENPLFLIDKTNPQFIKKHNGFHYSLSEKGWNSYQNQEFQILASNLLASNINRFISYAAVIIAFVALIVTYFKK